MNNKAEMKNLEEGLRKKIQKLISEQLAQVETSNFLNNTLDYLKDKKKVLLLSCSNRYNWDENNIDIPKSKMIAMYLHDALGSKSTLIDVPELKIFPCEGNVSRREGNSCGVLKSKLKDEKKNPSGHHRCWASVNNKSDELWKISKELFESDAVIFFSSVRWGQANMYYQNLIERLTWIENRHATLGESNLIKDIDAGFICIGQNWNGVNVVETQKQVHEFYGFKTNDSLYWNWQYTENAEDETQKSYKLSYKKFLKDTDINIQDLEAQ